MFGPIDVARSILLLASSAVLCRCLTFTGPGTTPDLEVIFKGRCAEYIGGHVYPHVDSEELRTKNCTLLWELFLKAFVYRDPCNVTLDMYADFVNEAATSIPANQAVYWDGFDVYSDVRSYVNDGHRGLTLEFTLVGYIMNGYLYFCGQTEYPGIKYDSCPSQKGDCGGSFPEGSINAFWAAASVYFGKYGAGKVKFIVNSNRPGGAFHTNDSFFAQYEVVNMDSSKISLMEIYIITFLDETPGETCESQSIETLRSMLDDRGISSTCTVQPEDVLHMFCADNPTAKDCAFAASQSSLRHEISRIGMAFGAVFVYLFSCKIH
ncbi:ADP-ribosyl cyclase/cyclic ADP-ribose hydrolase-like [Asterias amurensis]|uniref:ADP-ribosyl cyclase/cyclic ADP-ribose hydrolase-like n=1 Tax=Asterias amurensis TaxID=7602 RepID=UPI003AB318AD